MTKLFLIAGAASLGLAVSSFSADAAGMGAVQASALAAASTPIVLASGGRPVGTIQTPGSGRPSGTGGAVAVPRNKGR